MATGQKRSNREPKKPKTDKNEPKKPKTDKKKTADTESSAAAKPKPGAATAGSKK